MIENVKVESAKVKDVKEIAKLVNSNEGLVLPLALNQIYDQLRDFIVIKIDGSIRGCGAVHTVWDDLGEIRSVAISEENRKKGLGKLLIKNLIEMGKELGMNKLFVLTYQVEYFEKMGFKITPKESLPHKIWKACLNCPKFPNCDETAMILDI